MLTERRFIRFFIDMDGTTCDALERWVEGYNSYLPQEERIGVSDIYDYNFVGCIPDEKKDMFYSVLAEPGFFTSLAPLPNAIEIINALKAQSGVEIVFVTKPPTRGNCADLYKQGEIIADKMSWLYDHFYWFKHDQHFTVAYRRDVYGEGILIDDSPVNIYEFRPNGVGILMKHNYNIGKVEEIVSRGGYVLNNWAELPDLLSKQVAPNVSGPHRRLLKEISPRIRSYIR